MITLSKEEEQCSVKSQSLTLMKKLRLWVFRVTKMMMQLL
jgi:hypothetical protein